MIKVDKGGRGVKNVWILVDVNKGRSLRICLWTDNTDDTYLSIGVTGGTSIRFLTAFLAASLFSLSGSLLGN